MSRWYGKIGFSVQEETSPGIWNEVVVEKNYYGDISNRSRRWQQGQDLIDDITITNELTIMLPLSIVALALMITFSVSFGRRFADQLSVFDQSPS